MKRFIKILFTLILLIPISCFAYEKKEYVYTNLDTKGNEVEKIVNNELIVPLIILPGTSHFSFKTGLN